MLVLLSIGCIYNWTQTMMEIDALFVLCSLRIVKILVIFIHSLDCSYLVQAALQIDDQNISNLFISIFGILPLYDRKDLK